MPDTLGTSGNDTLQVFDGAANVIAYTGHDVINTGNYNDTVDGGGGDDTVNAGGGDNVIMAGGGNNVVNTDGGNDTISAGDGNDTVNSGAGNDRIDAGGGDNIVNAGDGNDVVFTGSGIDLIDLGGGDNFADTGAGNDRIIGLHGNDTINAGDGDDVVHANGGDNVVNGGAGDDSITAGDGDDTLVGGTGNDTIHANNGDNTIADASGNNVITAGRGDDSIAAGDGNDLIDADGGDNTVAGGGGNDTITASNGDDLIFGGAGDDVITTARGDDVVHVGAGSDTATLGNGDDTAVVLWADLATGKDRIAGNAGRDTLVVHLDATEADAAAVLQELVGYRDYGEKIHNLKATGFEAFKVLDLQGNAIDIDVPFINAFGGDTAKLKLAEGLGLGEAVRGGGTLTVSDPNRGEALDLYVTGVTVSGNTTGLGASTQQIAAMLSLEEPIFGGPIEANNVDWTFDSGSVGLDYLGAGETVKFTYTVEVADGRGATDTIAVNVAVTGTNDAPMFVGGGDAVALAETDAGLTASGDLTVVDPDISDAVALSVTGVSFDGNVGDLTGAELLAMLSLADTTSSADPGAADNVSWLFDSGSEAFDFLAEGETLTLDYDVTAIDGSGATDLETVSVTVTGTADADIPDKVTKVLTFDDVSNVHKYAGLNWHAYKVITPSANIGFDVASGSNVLLAEKVHGGPSFWTDNLRDESTDFDLVSMKLSTDSRTDIQVFIGAWDDNGNGRGMTVTVKADGITTVDVGWESVDQVQVTAVAGDKNVVIDDLTLAFLA